MKLHPMSEGSLKRLALGELAKVLIDLHLENPKQYDAEFILDKLVSEYSKQGLDLEGDAK